MTMYQYSDRMLYSEILINKLRVSYSRLSGYARTAKILTPEQLAVHSRPSGRGATQRLNILLGQLATLDPPCVLPASLQRYSDVARVALGYPGAEGRICSRPRCYAIHQRYHGWCAACVAGRRLQRKST